MAPVEPVLIASLQISKLNSQTQLNFASGDPLLEEALLYLRDATYNAATIWVPHKIEDPKTLPKAAAYLSSRAARRTMQTQSRPTFTEHRLTNASVNLRACLAAVTAPALQDFAVFSWASNPSFYVAKPDQPYCWIERA